MPRVGSDRCQHCRAAVFYVEMGERGKKLAIDYRPHPDGDIVLDGNRGRGVKEIEKRQLVADGVRIWAAHRLLCTGAKQKKREDAA